MIDVHLTRIGFPENLEQTKAEFERYCRLPQVIGAIDCTHIEIIQPPAHMHPEQYFNRKGWTSINVQAVCDLNLKFLSVNAEWPGSVHDSRIFANSAIYAALRNGQIDGILLADGG